MQPHLARAGRTIKQIINGAFCLDTPVVLYDDGSVRDVNGTNNTFSSGQEGQCGGGNVQWSHTCARNYERRNHYWFGTSAMDVDDATNTSVSASQGNS